MTREEFSSSFDTLLDSFAHQATSGRDSNDSDFRFDEYEKSVFLTNAQDELVLSLYNGRNSSALSFEETEELRRSLAPLIEEETISPIETSNGKPLGMESNSKFFTLPDNLWFITYERVAIEGSECEGKTGLDVYPVRQDEYHKIKKNPFRGANNRRALRLDLADNVVEIISKYGVTSYYVRYLKKLQPIVLQDFSQDGVSVRGVNTPTDCELPEFLHRQVLERAVQLAMQRGRITNNNENR